MSSVVSSGSEMVTTVDQWQAGMFDKGWRNEDDAPQTPSAPAEPPHTEEVPPLDDTSVPPLTEPADTEGG